MNRLLREIEQCRERYAKAKKKGDTGMMALWERVGKNLKRQVKERSVVNSDKLFEKTQDIFGVGDET